MNKFKKTITPEKAANKSQARLLFINNLVRRRRTEAGAGILALVALHFVSQFIFFPEENFLSRQTVLEEKTEQTIVVKNEPSAAQRDVEVKNAAVEPQPVAERIALPEPKTAAALTAKKKIEAREPKVTHESKAERLRRAERLLTGN